MSETLRVLVTGAGTTTAVTVLKALLAANDPTIRVLMGDMNPDCAGAHLGDEFVLMPPARSPDFSDRVLDLCRQQAVDLVIPILDYEFLGWIRAAGYLRDNGTR